MVQIKGLFKDLDPISRFYKNQRLILFLTFITYATFHATRKSFSVVKTRLRDADPIGWAPFNNPETGQTLLGFLDTVFLATYALTMLFIAGPLADRANLRLFIPMGLLGSGIGLMMWALAYSYDIHNLTWFILANLICGVFQSFGWPAIISILSTWVLGPNRGLIISVWNVNTYLGNIVGSMIGGAVLESEADLPWPYVFFYPSLLSFVIAVIFLWLIQPTPKHLDFEVSVDVNNQVIIDTKQHREQVHAMQESVRMVDRDDGFNDTLPRLNSNVSAASQSPSRGQSKRITPRGSDSSNNNSNHMNRSHLDDIDVDVDLAITPTQSRPASKSTKNNKNNKNNKNAQFDGDGDGDDDDDDNNNNDDEEQGFQEGDISFTQALLVPGVLQFSLSLFFCKFVSYTFLFWLPYFLSSNNYPDGVASYLSIYFDLGSIIGSVLCGYLDRYRKPGTTSATMLLISAPLLLIYYKLTTNGQELTFILHVTLLLLLGIFITGPYSLITTAVAIDLGSHPALGSSKKAMATVSGIIDGFGSLGSINSGLLISLVSKIGRDATDPSSPKGENWQAVFILLMVCVSFGAIFLVRIVDNETGRLGFFVRFLDALWYVLTLGGSCCGLCYCCANDDSNAPHSHGSSNIGLGDFSSEYSRSVKKGQKGHNNDTIDSLGYVDNPSDLNVSCDDTNDLGQGAGAFQSYRASHLKRKSPEARYKKENKMLKKEKQRQERSNNDNNNDDEHIDVSKLYKQAQRG